MRDAPRPSGLGRVRENGECAKKQRLAAPPGAAAAQTLIAFFQTPWALATQISLKGVITTDSPQRLIVINRDNPCPNAFGLFLGARRVERNIAHDAGFALLTLRPATLI
jgi:hypothetical protein